MKLNGVLHLVPYVRRRKLSFAAILCLSCVNAFASLLPVQFLGAVIDLLTAGSANFPILGQDLSGMLALYAAALGVQYAVANGYGYLTSLFSDRIIEDVRSDALGWALESFKPYKEERKEGDILSRLTGDIDAITRVIAGPLNNLLPLTLKLIFSLIVLFLWSAQLGIIAAALTIPLYYASTWIARQSKDIGRKQREAQGELVNAVSNTLYSIPVISAWQAAAQEVSRIQPLGRNLTLLKKELGRKYVVYWLITQTITCIGLVSAVAISARSVVKGHMTVGGITIAYNYISNVMTPIAALSRYGGDLHQADAALARVFALRAELPKPDGEQLQKAPEISFADVNIVCSSDQELCGVNFSAKPHSLTAFSGPSGSGKSTLLHAVLGFQPIESGQIRIGRYAPGQCAASIGVAFQNSYLMDRSIRDNVAFGDSDPDDGRIMALAEELGLSEMLAERGLDFSVGTQGKSLSGGQQRRLALARAAYRPKPVYLFDEPTAELDDAGRTLVLRFLEKLKAHATVLVTSHDEAVLGIADQIIPVEDFVRRRF